MILHIRASANYAVVSHIVISIRDSVKRDALSSHYLFNLPSSYLGHSPDDLSPRSFPPQLTRNDRTVPSKFTVLPTALQTFDKRFITFPYTSSRLSAPSISTPRCIGQPSLTSNHSFPSIKTTSSPASRNKTSGFHYCVTVNRIHPSTDINPRHNGSNRKERQWHHGRAGHDRQLVKPTSPQCL